ncbi:hypothetical protein DPX16_18910 [Anabarilius grahami]|uniref:Uncharacterized protein n=1 Tax=Anabarilius grahami TaxID=495550 RepID=A0A3N0YLH5_ANAGA|nr:hypothetical protein DPX16_18910 [Anabarilius grahami]
MDRDHPGGGGEDGVSSKPLEGKPANFSQKSVTANANAPPLAVRREGDQRPFFEWMSMDERLHYEERTFKTTGYPQSMGLFIVSEAPASPMPPTPVSAADRLIGLLQDGCSLERYVEEFVELAFLTNWSDACLNTLFLEGLDECTIRFDEPDDYDSLNDTVNLILYLNGSKFVVEEVPEIMCMSRPVPPETGAAWPVRRSPSSSTYPFSELFPCVLLDPHRRKKKPACLEPAPALSEPASTLAEHAPASYEQSRDATWLIDFWTEPVAPALSEQVYPVSAEPSAPADAAHEPTPAYISTP